VVRYKVKENGNSIIRKKVSWFRRRSCQRGVKGELRKRPFLQVQSAIMGSGNRRRKREKKHLLGVVFGKSKTEGTISACGCFSRVKFLDRERVSKKRKHCRERG